MLSDANLQLGLFVILLIIVKPLNLYMAL